MQHKPVTFIKIFRLGHRNLDRNRHDHLTADGGVPHLFVVRPNLHHKSRKLVRSPEFQEYVPVGVRVQERLESQRGGKVRANGNVLNPGLFVPRPGILGRRAL